MYGGATFSILSAIKGTGVVGTWDSAQETTRLFINEDGNVGIGTSSPSTTLNVNGPVRVGQYTTATLPSASAAGVGSMAYDTTTDTLKVVNNSNTWVNV